MSAKTPTLNRQLTAASRALALLFAGVLISAPALAAKPDSPGKGKNDEKSAVHGGGHGKSQGGKSHHGQGREAVKFSVHFEDRHRSVIRDYFRGEFGRGHCPPGLAKKHNGCMPPGQAKKWAIGHPLPHDVIYYSLPGALLRELGRAPDGHKYVRVAADVLLIAVGTGMVVDAIEDLSSL